jgi:DNA-binding MarR family transcriptional regulator
MIIQHRVLPTREVLIEDNKGKLSPEELSAVDLMLHFWSTAYTFQAAVYEKYKKKYGLSEGNITLMMALNHFGSLGILTIAQRVGVKPPTASVMVKRMLKNPDPFIELLPTTGDGRAKMVKLTARGEEVLREELLPGLNGDMVEIASALTPAEQEEFLRLVRKLSSQPE